MPKSTTLRAKNNTASTILNGKIVYATGFDNTGASQQTLVDLADNRYSAKMPAIGVLCEDASSGASDIIVKTSGPCAGFDTLGMAINAEVYVGQSGGITLLKPHDSNDAWFTQQIGTVLTQDEYPYGQIQVLPHDIEQKVSHNELKDVTASQHHAKKHAESHSLYGSDPLPANIFVEGNGLIGRLPVWSRSKVIDNSTIFNSSDNKTGFGTDFPTHTITLPSTSSGVAVYNSIDQQVNYERVVIDYSSNVFRVNVESDGSGSARDIAFAVNGTETIRFTSSNDVGIGTGSPVARFHIIEDTVLGTSSGNSQIISSTQGWASTNQVRNNIWLYRDAAGSDWTTARFHDAVAIDSSFGTPRTDTKCWYERDPLSGIHEWGNAGTSYMRLHPTNTGQLGIGIAPTSILHLNTSTENLEIVDAGSVSATEQGWIEVKLDGDTTGYIRVYATK